ncbi:MAG: phosphatase PAP2 family protein [Acidimicrobiaceae bacterium]|jgi:membrane-associated phospholipid phosphatase|nr:phosphatase PAP2 family protein [Ilumatobacteraceae bacterium]
MLTPRRLTISVTVLTLVVAFMIWQVVAYEWLAQADYRAVQTARRLAPDKGFFKYSVHFGLRGMLLTVFLPILSWVAWKRRSWVPLVGFLIVLLFETGITGALKLSIGRELPWQSWPLMGRLETGELGFPSGHATNVPALIGYMVWFFTAPQTRVRRWGWVLVAVLVVVVDVSSWMIRTHWPTDLYAGNAVGLIALLTIIAFMNASGLSPWATAPQTQEVHRESLDD